jgi:HEPN domain-containing protein
MNDRREETEESRWLRYAREDIRCARALRAEPGIVPREACAMSQEAAEKAMKAVLILERTRVTRTHDLREIRLMQRDHLAPDVSDEALNGLTGWLVKGRYPGDWDEATPTDADTALATAEIVVAAAEQRIDPSGDGAS